MKVLITSGAGFIGSHLAGKLFEAGNFKQLAEKMFYLLNDEAKSVEIGGEARDCVKEKYSIGRVVSRIEELYRDVVRAY
jgi:glycosyltransferase involved in cell wall biosynthesis